MRACAYRGSRARAALPRLDLIALRLADDRYPEDLRAVARPPDPIWVDGDLDCLALDAVTIVGTRRMSAYGERVARELARAVARAGVVVVSGLATGIDSAAHHGALDAGGPTVAVLGEGIACVLASAGRGRRALAQRVRTNGALVSQYEPNFIAQPWAFVRRNTTLAALGRAVVVVEAGEASGAFITAGEARALGRPLYAVPGPLGSAASVGTNRLIARGDARALVDPDQLLASLGVATPRVAPEPIDPVLDALAGGPLDADALAARVRGTAGQLQSTLARLVLRGAVSVMPDGRYRRV